MTILWLFLFVQMNAVHCIGGQNKNYTNVTYLRAR